MSSSILIVCLIGMYIFYNFSPLSTTSNPSPRPLFSYDIIRGTHRSDGQLGTDLDTIIIQEIANDNIRLFHDPKFEEII